MTLRGLRTFNHPAWMRAAIVAMAIAAVVWLGYEFWRLLFQDVEGGSDVFTMTGALDLKRRHHELEGWFAGEPIYAGIKGAVYPPASYLMLWPLLGWTGVDAARWLWALTTVLALYWLVRTTVRETGAESRQHKLFVGLIPLCIYATGATIGNGQLLVHMMPVLVVSLISVARPGGLGRDVFVAALMTLALVKPSVSAPFFWIILFVPGSLRPAAMVLIGYAGLTWFASAFQSDSVWSLVVSWTERARGASQWSVTIDGGKSNQQAWLAALDLPHLSAPTALLALLALGVWTWWHRTVEIWLLIGVSALVARFWTYHRWYDDMLLVLPMIALFRLALGQRERVGDPWAGLLLVLTLGTTIAPGGLHLLPPPWNGYYTAIQTVVWMTVLVYLAYRTVVLSPRCSVPGGQTP